MNGYNSILDLVLSNVSDSNVSRFYDELLDVDP